MIAPIPQLFFVCQSEVITLGVPSAWGGGLDRFPLRSLSSSLRTNFRAFKPRPSQQKTRQKNVPTRAPSLRSQETPGKHHHASIMRTWYISVLACLIGTQPSIISARSRQTTDSIAPVFHIVGRRCRSLIVADGSHGNGIVYHWYTIFPPFARARVDSDSTDYSRRPIHRTTFPKQSALRDHFRLRRKRSTAHDSMGPVNA